MREFGRMEPNSPSFDTWTSLFSFAIVQALLLAIVLWVKGPKQRLLGHLLFLFATMLVEYVVWWTGYYQRFPHVMNISAQLPFLFGPLLWFYLRLVYENKKWRWTDAWHFLPFVLAFAQRLPWYLESGEEKLAGLMQRDLSWLRWLVLNARLLHLGIYAVLILRFAWQQQQTRATRRWIWVLSLGFALFSLSYISYFILSRFPFFNLQWDYQISLSMTLLIFAIAYLGYIQPSVFDDLDWNLISTAKKNIPTQLSEKAMLELRQQLDQLMQKDALFLEPELRLEDLAKRLGVSRYQLSEVLNKAIGCNFYEYLNDLRIEKAHQLLLEDVQGKLSIKEIAYEAGFNNKVSFYNAFRKKYGVAPLEYRRKKLEEGALATDQ
jgi:AraC-like DNA-binding protein